jgi:hypothetical protein
MIQCFRFGAGVTALKAFPLQFEHSTADDVGLGLKNFKVSQAAAQRKLKEIYQQAGFFQVGRTPYMLRAREEPLHRFG